MWDSVIKEYGTDLLELVTSRFVGKKKLKSYWTMFFGINLKIDILNEIRLPFFFQPFGRKWALPSPLHKPIGRNFSDIAFPLSNLVILYRYGDQILQFWFIWTNIWYINSFPLFPPLLFLFIDLSFLSSLQNKIPTELSFWSFANE